MEDINMCDCCKDIWNVDNLKVIQVGEHELHLCSECYKSLAAPFKLIKKEIKEIPSFIITGVHSHDVLSGDGMREKCLKIINKYKW